METAEGHGLAQDGCEGLSVVPEIEATHNRDAMLEEATDLYLQLEAARELNEASALILGSVGEGIYGLDANGMTTFANPATETMTGWKAEQLIGLPQHAILHHSHADGSAYAQESCPIYLALRDGRVHRSDNEVFWRKDGTSFPVAYTSTPILRNGRPVGAVILFQDISKRKRREAWERSKNSIFSAITSHLKLESTLAMIADAFVALHPCYPIALLLRSDAGLRLAAQAGLPRNLQQFFRTVLAGELATQPTSVCVRVAEQGREILARRGHPEPGSPEYSELSEVGFESCLAVPLLSGSGQVLGTVAVFGGDDGMSDPLGRESVDSACDLARLAIEHSRLHAELVRQSQYDHLTGLPNRLLLEDRVEQAIAQAKRHGTRVGVCYIDLDRFKQINDTLGHSMGDAFLQHIAAVLKGSLREIDTVARQGGDEFILVLPDLTSEGEAEEICERVLSHLRRRVTIGEHTFLPSASVGLSQYPAAGTSGPTLLRNADIAMYAAKREGKERVQQYHPLLGEKVHRDMELQNALRFALEGNEFTIVYQPLYSISRQIKGFEALLRWMHPEFGPISPDRFIPLAEETGLIVPIGEWVLTEACRQAVEWNVRTATSVKMFVNISGVQLGRLDFAETTSRALAQSGLAPGLLELEVTESWIIADPEAASLRLRRLRELGIGISIDDFGTGHSSFGCLQQLPVSTIKIDKSFIARLDGSATGSAIVRTILALAEELGLETVAEGVETGLQFHELEGTQCSLLQGYLLAKPLQPDAARLLLEAGETVSA